MLDEIPDRASIARIAHDPDALEDFYRRHIDAVGRFVARRVDDAHTAADLTADVFMAAIRGAASYRGGPGGDRAWLYGIARNVVADSRRRALRELDARRRVAGRRLLDEDDIQRFEERFAAESEARRVYTRLNELPQGEREVIELVAIDGLTVTEAATALGIRAVTARVRLHRARKALAAVPAAPAVASEAAPHVRITPSEVNA
ncbi:RNA polymerase sigma factor [Yinghuangia seranimata]|uniref:RNA polymerase sigma factor n=1 Tax=Yinghuangia seranimata TaxID=408067 RepID=UPI00248C0852|nr:RNA polymerase sigma factor [Yinghuangia seranimata]MDI2127849.1 RNA polymerase sigma factor [Yinghuangia seranimata]